MSPSRTLCLNMIVRNEMANLPRCLAAVAPFISCWIIGDTGSTDGTQDYVRSFFSNANVPGELHAFPFVNFEQARNEALDRAYASPLAFDYLLLADADMELIVEDTKFRTRLEAAGHQLLQRSTGGLRYWNTRLVRRTIGARYHGVTHEYINVPGGCQPLEGVWYKDHATGSNRVDKFERDIKLLAQALEQEPENTRYWYYLAQSYRDAGRTQEAAAAFAKRAAMPGWVEETWEARLQLARCLRDLDDEPGFLRAALAAFNERPQRAEPLYDLARYYRIKGQNEASILFSERGLGMPVPQGNFLFVEDAAYNYGLREEFAICAFYAHDPRRKNKGRDVCDSLALDRNIPAAPRHLARQNSRYYSQPASALMPSFTARKVGFAPPDGYHPTNPSVARDGAHIVLLQRAVNYTVANGQYRTPDDVPVHTQNFLLRLDPSLQIESAAPLLPPADLPPPAFTKVLGFEDARLFAWRGGLWCSANLRELTPEGWCEQVLARIDGESAAAWRLADWRVLRPKGARRHEKNWMPQVEGDRLRFIQACDPTRVVDEQARPAGESTPAIAADMFRGGSQAIAFDGGWAAVIHEVDHNDDRRLYWHRFVWFDSGNVLRRVSPRFFFKKQGVEFVAGMAWHPDGKRLLISYGVDDTESWLADVDAEEVRQTLQPCPAAPDMPVEKPV